MPVYYAVYMTLLHVNGHVEKWHSRRLAVLKTDFQLVVKRNEKPICKGFGDIGRVSITASDVMPISPLGAPNFKSDLIFWKPTSAFLLAVNHAKFHFNRFSSFGSPGCQNSPFSTGLENGSYNSVTHKRATLWWENCAFLNYRWASNNIYYSLYFCRWWQMKLVMVCIMFSRKLFTFCFVFPWIGLLQTSIQISGRIAGSA